MRIGVQSGRPGVLPRLAESRARRCTQAWEPLEGRGLGQRTLQCPSTGHGLFPGDPAQSQGFVSSGPGLSFHSETDRPQHCQNTFLRSLSLSGLETSHEGSQV